VKKATECASEDPGREPLLEEVVQYIVDETAKLRAARTDWYSEIDEPWWRNRQTRRT